MTLPTHPRIAIIGLGYVGLPLAVEFGKKYPVTGFDIKQSRIDQLNAGRDNTREVEPAELAEAKHLSFTADPEQLRRCNIFIVTVPSASRACALRREVHVGQGRGGRSAVSTNAVAPAPTFTAFL